MSEEETQRKIKEHFDIRGYNVTTMVWLRDKEYEVCFESKEQGFLSGDGGSGIYTIQDDKLKEIKRIDTWMS